MKNRYLAALQEQLNLLGLGSLVALAAATTSAEPLLVGLAVEAVYLMVVPNSGWFALRLARQRDAEIAAQRAQLKEEILPQLRPDLRARYLRLETLRADIAKQPAVDKLSEGELLDKLDFLGRKWLQFALKDQQFRAYLDRARPRKSDESAPPDWDDQWARATVEFLRQSHDADIARIEDDLGREADENTRGLLQKRREVLLRRREFGARIGTITGNLSQQLALVEDAFGLIHDELWARPPEQILDQVEEVVSQTRIMTEVLEAMAPYERMLTNIG